MQVREERKIVLTFRANVVKAAPDRWATQYSGSYRNDETERKTERLLALKAAGPFTAEQVNEIIGNSSWTELRCSECRDDVEVLAVFGGDDYDWQNVCANCLRTALAEIARSESA